MVDCLAENARRSCWDEWAGLTCPTLAVFGQGGIIAPEDCDRMLQQRPETVALSVPGAGHDRHLERPDVLEEALERFLPDTGECPGAERT